jgi:hypothetical protein
MRKAASIGKPVLSADSAAVGAALAELPAGALVAQCAVGLTEIALAETLLNLSNGRALAEIPSSAPQGAVGLAEMIALSGAIADALARITRPEAAGASLTEIAASEIALAETLLNLSNGRALAEIPSSALEPMCHVRVIGAKTAPEAGIVRPPVSVPNACTIEIISVDEVIVYEDVVVSPSSVPSPVVPAPTPNRTKGKSSSP